MKRKIYEKLLEWKSIDHGTSAVLINGARRVGKSYIAEEFAKREYRNYLLIDFSKAKDDFRVTDTFRTYLSQPKEFFRRLSVIYNMPFYERDTLFIFDEVQKFPRAREAIKTLVADGRYDFIETGSLVSINENVKDILIPSEEIDIDMYPMDFEEFLWAKGNETLMPMIRECFEKRIPMGPVHRVAMDALREYLIVGGMPQVINRYLETNDFKAADREKRKILALYRKGIKEHAGALVERVEALYDFIPSQLQQHEKKVVLADLEPEARMRDYQDPLFWLKDARVVNVAYNASNSTVIILDNSITGMTGHQQNPTTGKNLKGDPAAAVDLEALCHAIGIKRVRVADPYHLAEMEQAITEELAVDEPSVIISRRPCALLKYVKHNPPLHVENDKCRSCKMCLKLGCPAISMKNGKACIDHTQCVGCGICEELCKFDAIRK